MTINVVLVNPEIPQNAGNIIRTCACTNSKLHLVKPYGFSIEDKHYKRAGLDYFDKANIFEYESLEEFLEINKDANMYLASTKSKHIYSDVKYKDNDFILFGKESGGLPEPLIEKHYDHAIRIPMANEMRSLNLANSVAIILYHALAQNDFIDLETKGNLTNKK